MMMETTEKVEVRELTRFFYALKEAWRLRMLCVLAESGELTVSELAERLHISQPLASWHLRRLRQAKIVSVRREGRESFYTVDREHVTACQAALEQLLHL
jgi:DNA-binding transcriptional ArsR family regulator